MKSFHEKTFDTGTQLKLALFRGYIREWIPVFLSQANSSHLTQVNFYDFFAGPGHDRDKKPGTPLIILEEIKQYCASNQQLQNSNITMIFNDKNPKHIEKLQGVISTIQCSKGCCNIRFSHIPFKDAFSNCLNEMGSANSANLIIMDQFGVKEVTPEIIRQLAMCSRTDVLFFISSAFIRRFIDTPELSEKFKDLTADAVKDVEYNAIHRTICSYFQTQLQDVDYYLAPFSIRKNSNIYGVIFGSSNLLGLDKFLRVCWAIDPITGEANYNIDSDFAAWSKQPSLFSKLNSVKKIDIFRKDLENFISKNSPDNHDVYKYSLKRGFPPKKANEVLKEIQKNQNLKVITITDGTFARKGAFYLSYDALKEAPKVQYVLG